MNNLMLNYFIFNIYYLLLIKESLFPYDLKILMMLLNFLFKDPLFQIFDSIFNLVQVFNDTLQLQQDCGVNNVVTTTTMVITMTIVIIIVLNAIPQDLR